MRLSSQVIITSHSEETLTQLQAEAKAGERFEIIRPEEAKSFSVKDARRAMEKAYLSSHERVIVVLVADAFSEVVQNKLLKALEEPPLNTEFVLILPARSTLLPTITSRLPVTVLDEKDEREALELDMRKLDVRSVYEFVKDHIRADNKKAKVLLEKIASSAIKSGQYNIDERTLDMFRDSRVVLDKGSPPSFVLTGILLKLLAKRVRG
jgi:DNA polymerase-3 subunit delta'